MHTQTASPPLQAVTLQGITSSMTPKAKELAEIYFSRKSLLIALSDNQCFADAIMLLSNAMPHPKGLRWALNCVQRNNGDTALSEEKAITLNTTAQWLDKPNEDIREKILPTSTIAQPSPVTWLAMAAYWSGGGISHNESESPEPVPDELIHDSIYSSVMLSIQEMEEQKQHIAYKDAIKQGIKILYS